MSTPNRVVIHGAEYKIEFKNLCDSQGETHLDRQVIYLDPSYAIEHQKDTLLHEILHVSFQARWQYQVEAIAHVSDAGLREHLLIDPVATSVRQILKENPKVREWLLNE